MKKIFVLLLTLMTFVLVGCDTNEAKSDFDIILDKIEINYQLGDNDTSVTKDLNLPVYIDSTVGYEHISWTSSRPSIIDANGKVTRQQTNQEVTLAVTVVINGVGREKLFQVVVLGISDSSEAYIVSFNADGGTLISSQNINHGDLVVKPNDPNKPGYLFKGWYLDDLPYDFNQPVVHSFELKANYEVIPTTASYTVSFDTNGGDKKQPIIVYENRLVETSNPTRGSDQFVGWFKDLELMKPWNLNSDVVTQDLILYAKWAFSDTPFIPGRTLTFNDEFSGTSLDETKWSYQNGTGREYGLWWWGNDEKQYYKPENTVVSDGSLKIYAKLEQTYDPLASTTMHYSSSKIVTQNKFSQTFGRFEARVRVPLAEGFWPAFWLMPESSVYGGWPRSGEIDIVEWRGRIPNEASSAIHFQASHGHQYQYRNYTLPQGQTIDQFHVYAVEWSLGKLEFSVDNHVYHTRHNTWHNAPQPFDQDFFIILNFAIGGHFDGHKLPPPSAFPAFMEVDYVRAYQGL